MNNIVVNEILGHNLITFNIAIFVVFRIQLVGNATNDRVIIQIIFEVSKVLLTQERKFRKYCVFLFLVTISTIEERSRLFSF